MARTFSAVAFSTASRNSSTSSEFSAFRRSARCSSMVVTASTRVTPINMRASLTGSRRPGCARVRLRRRGAKPQESRGAKPRLHCADGADA
ncbi:hypothetical protein I553_4439 [Mycobacterium xenopi 4042]|uniref:Uncharacterized protein n=1 Tax=Mycobacterium xenopi 4042 TaxID=1299334 RepID=X8AE23_MYCXE|nr:hypothetical protein I553_4439 [Mycobacterium xenopi 4042]